MVRRRGPSRGDRFSEQIPQRIAELRAAEKYCLKMGKLTADYYVAHGLPVPDEFKTDHEDPPAQPDETR